LKSAISEEEIENLKPDEDDTIKLTECKTVPSEIGKVMTFINVGWQGGNNEGQEWLEVNGWCISIDETGEWKRVKKTKSTCSESADSVVIPEPVDIPIPQEPEPVCNSANLDLCDQSNCEIAGGGFWYDDVCNVEDEVAAEPEPVPEIDTDAEHSVSS